MRGYRSPLLDRRSHVPRQRFEHWTKEGNRAACKTGLWSVVGNHVAWDCNVAACEAVKSVHCTLWRICQMFRQPSWPVHTCQLPHQCSLARSPFTYPVKAAVVPHTTPSRLLVSPSPNGRMRGTTAPDASLTLRLQEGRRGVPRENSFKGARQTGKKRSCSNLDATATDRTPVVGGAGKIRGLVEDRSAVSEMHG